MKSKILKRVFYNKIPFIEQAVAASRYIQNLKLVLEHMHITVHAELRFCGPQTFIKTPAHEERTVYIIRKHL